MRTTPAFRPSTSPMELRIPDLALPLAGSFVAPDVKAGASPDATRTIKAQLWVSSAFQGTATHDDGPTAMPALAGLFGTDRTLAPGFGQHENRRAPAGLAIAPA